MKTIMNYAIKKLLTKTLFIMLITISTTVLAVDPPPMVMLKNTSDQMIAELNKNLGHLTDAYVSRIVRHILVPRIDVTNMAQNVVGRTYWQSAPSSLQQQFIAQFTTYVIRTYSAALVSYDGETISFYPIRGYTPDQTRVQINSIINHKKKPGTRVQYRVLNRGGSWFVYDFSVDGVSFIQNYRSQFSGTLQQGGMSLLVQKLVEKNKNYNY